MLVWILRNFFYKKNRINEICFKKILKLFVGEEQQLHYSPF
jgi:hypothetical protein